mmetsp:Transcript_44743/g.103501  ORF Transcript_44743/g.103501 Transcript_44743/m.103501 type:complete len:216 (-) Transcript_44743:44-691(-)
MGHKVRRHLLLYAHLWIHKHLNQEESWPSHIWIQASRSSSPICAIQCLVTISQIEVPINTRIKLYQQQSPNPLPRKVSHLDYSLCNRNLLILPTMDHEAQIAVIVKRDRTSGVAEDRGAIIVLLCLDRSQRKVLLLVVALQDSLHLKYGREVVTTSTTPSSFQWKVFNAHHSNLHVPLTAAGSSQCHLHPHSHLMSALLCHQTLTPWPSTGAHSG